MQCPGGIYDLILLWLYMSNYKLHETLKNISIQGMGEVVTDGVWTMLRTKWIVPWALCVFFDYYKYSHYIHLVCVVQLIHHVHVGSIKCGV